MSSSSKTTARLKIAGMIGAGVLAGAAIAATGVASAASGSSSTTTSSSSSATPSAPSGGYGMQQGGGPGGYGGAHMGHGGANPVRSDEKQVTGSTADTLKAAALKAVPGATVYRVETDAGDGAYEVHLTKSDGSDATVKFDKNLKLIRVEAGMGLGDPAPQGTPSSSTTG